MKPSPQAEVIRRLRTAAGHLQAVIEMTESGQPCEEVLHQLNAVEAALHAAGACLIRLHVDASQAIILSNPSAARRSVELKRLLSLYSAMFHQSNQTYEVTK